MTYIVTFEDYYPAPRHDNIPFYRATIEESASENGPWTEIEEFILSPQDEDPAHPIPRNFTTDLATLPQGWYRIIFWDESGVSQSATGAIQNIPPETEPYLPTVREVAQLIFARTRDDAGVERGTFTTTTRPTYEQAWNHIVQSADRVTASIDVDIPDSASRWARETIATRAAMTIERSYYSDQVNTGRSIYPALRDDLKDALKSLLEAISRETSEAEDGEDSGGSVRHYFPADEMIGLKTIWN